MPVEVLTVEANYVGASLDKGLKGATKELAATANAAAKLDSTLGKQLTKGSNTAGQSLVNLGRIAQDAPFGFIGIQNNINPLIESFGRLKAETGSTGGALKALAGSLVGAGGLGLAVSVVTGLLTVFAMNSRGANKEVKEGKKEVDLAAEAQKAFESAVKSASDAIIGQAKNIKDVRTLLIDTSAAYNDLTESTKRQAFAQFLFGERSKEVQNILDAVIKQQLQQSKIKNPFAGSGVRQYAADLFAVKNFQDDVKKGLIQFSAAGLEAAKSTQAIAESQADLNNLNAIGQGFDSLFASIVNGSSKAPKSAKEIETVSSTLRDLKKEIDFLNSVQLTFGTDESAAKIKEIESVIRTLIKDFNVRPEDSIIQKLLTGGKLVNIVQGLNIPGIKGLTKDIAKVIKTEALSQPTPTITIPINIQAAIEKLNSGGQGAIQSFLVDATDTVEGALNGLFSNIGNSIGDTLSRALQGTASIGDFFKGIFNQLGASMKELGKFFIQTGVQIKVIKQFLIKNPALAIAGGLALVALGGLIQARTNTPGFATGGTAPGGSILVGERGPEIITAPRGATITPNAQTNAMLSGANGGTVVFRIQGRELVGVLNNTNATLGRNGQG
jgi:uncharacterized protein YeeX (DUF496 family)